MLHFTKVEYSRFKYDLEVLSWTQPEFEPMTSRSWQYMSCTEMPIVATQLSGTSQSTMHPKFNAAGAEAHDFHNMIVGLPYISPRRSS